MPSCNIHDSCWWLQDFFLFNQRLDLIVFGLWLIIVLSIWFLILIFLLSFDKKRTESSSFLSGGVIILEKFIQELVTNSYKEFLVLQVWLISSFLLHLQDVTFHLIRKQGVNNLPEEFSLRKYSLLSMRSRHVVKSFWTVLGYHSIAILDTEFRPSRNPLIWNIFLKKNLFVTIHDILHVAKSTSFLWRHKVSESLCHIWP